MNTIINSLTVLRGLQKNELFTALTEYCSIANGDRQSAFNDLLYEIYAAGAESNFAGYLSQLIIRDENAFSRGCASGTSVSDCLVDAMKRDLSIIDGLLDCLTNATGFVLGNTDYLLTGDKSQVIAKLADFYSLNGYGEFINNRAFAFNDGELVPLPNADGVTLEQLKNYADEKKIILDNVNDFLNGLPYSHILLYGDKGTGKSSTVHAVVNKLFGKKLRLVEISKKDVHLIPDVKRRLENVPLKFILFLDDLSLDEQSDDIPTLKTVLEGSFSNTFGNVLLIATSNRRHIVKENHSDRQNSVHPSDSIDEQLSLADRFGLTVMFSATDKKAYLSIVDQLADDYKLKTDRETIRSLSERWAIVKGGRSPRRAKQFIDLVYSCEQSGRPIEF